MIFDRRQFAGYGAFAGAWENWCQQKYGSDPTLLQKCNSKPWGFATLAPWTDVGKSQRGLPDTWVPSLENTKPQDIINEAGKIVRVNPDGTVTYVPGGTTTGAGGSGAGASWPSYMPQTYGGQSGLILGVGAAVIVGVLLLKK